MGRVSDAKERLLASAETLIHERGYNAVGVNEICKHAGVNKGSFYHFFPSKQTLTLDMVDAVWLRTRESMESALLGDGPPVDRLRSYFEQVHGYHSASCRGEVCGCPLGNLVLEMSTQDSLLRNRLLQTFEGHLGYFEQVLREARQRGDIDASIDPRKGAEALLALLQGQVMLAKLRNDAEVLKDLADSALRLIGAPNP